MIPSIHLISAEVTKNITSPAPGGNPILSRKPFFNS